MFSISDICKHAELIHFAGAEVKYLQKVISKHDGNTELEKMLREIEVLRRTAFRVCRWRCYLHNVEVSAIQILPKRGT